MKRRRGAADQRARAHLAPLVASGRAVCHRCQRPIRVDEAWDAGHLDAIAEGGHPAGRVVPEHVSCNRRDGARITNERRAARRSRTRDWLAFFPATSLQDTPCSVIFSPELHAF